MSEQISLVRILPDFLIDQIAAGEVVENPASVVKELVENSIDAGAGRIVVEIEGGGLSVIRVLDDGCGMSAIDAVTAMGRHATSKIRDAGDLLAIRTMGFRGEALPSIASVSRFRMKTRRAGDETGILIEAAGGKVDSGPCACPAGTSVEVRDLFFNVPARLKFQKGEKAQSMAVAETFRKAALAHSGVHFVLRSGARTLADYPPCRSLFDRVAMVIGQDCAGDLFRFEGARPGIEVCGVLGSPAIARGDSSRAILLVNGRPVVDAQIRRVMASAYGPLIASGRFPVVVADISIDPSDVDVNVHPGKHEVRFRDQREVASLLYESMSAVVDSTPWIQAGSGPSSGGATAFSQQAWAMPPSGVGVAADMFVSGHGVREAVSGAPGIDAQAVGAGSVLRYLGQAGNTVLVCEGEDCIVFIDQHAAHERINFNKLWEALEAGNVASERLLFPEVVTLDALDIERFEPARDALEKAGFDLERYSGDSIAVHAVPALVHGRSVEPVVREAVHAVSELASGSGDAVLRKIVATIACHASVRAGDRLSDVEARALIAGMGGVALSSYCPHGRQAVVVHRLADVLKSFDR